MVKSYIFTNLGLLSYWLIPASILSHFVFIPQMASAVTRTGNISPRSGPSGKIEFISKPLETTCTLKTSNGRLAYYVDTNGTQYISSAQTRRVSRSAREISTNAAKSGQIRAKANLPKGLWKLVFDRPSLKGKSRANQRQLLVSNLNGGDSSGWKNKINNYIPRVNANTYKELSIDVKFSNKYFKPGVYRASVVVTCMAA